MTVITYLLNIVIFFVLSTLIQALYSKLISLYQLNLKWLAPVIAAITVIVWMVSPASRLVLILFAVTVGITAGDKDNKSSKKMLY